MLSRTLPLLLAVACVASAATVDTRNSPRFQPSQNADERDGGQHHGGGGGSSGGSSSHHASSSGSSSYSAPTHSQPASSYSAPQGSSGGNEQGNLYYYYYPVEEYGNTEAADAGFDVFTAIILPLLILGALLLGLSSYTFNFTTGRALGGDNNAETGVVDQMQGEIERIFYLYLNAFESESCIQRTICESGVYAREYKNKEFVMSMVDPFIPETMKGNMALFKMAAKNGFEVGKCKKYRCAAPKIFN